MITNCHDTRTEVGGLNVVLYITCFIVQKLDLKKSRSILQLDALLFLLQSSQ